MQSLDLSMMPTNDTSIIFEDKMMVMDNLGDAHQADSVEVNSFMNRFPLKLSSSCMLIVIKGEVKFSVNFRDFVAGDNTCAIISAGTIVEHVAVDDEAKLIFLSFSHKELPSTASIRQSNVHRLYALQVVLLHLLPVQVELMQTTYHMLRVILTDTAFNEKKEQAAFNCINLLGSIIEQGTSNQPEVSSKTSRKDEIVAHFLQCVSCNVCMTITASTAIWASMPTSCASRSSTCLMWCLSRRGAIRHDGSRIMSFSMPKRCCAAGVTQSSRWPMS